MPEFLSNPNQESSFGSHIDSDTKSVVDEYERQNIKKLFKLIQKIKEGKKVKIDIEHMP